MSLTHSLPSVSESFASVPPRTLCSALADHLQCLTLPRGTILRESGDPVRHLYFPTTAVIATRAQRADGSIDEICCVGREGVLGVRSLLGADAAASRDIVLTGGVAYRIERDTLRALFARDEGLQDVLLRYINVLVSQFAQETICSRRHCVEQRVSRWLLQNHDRNYGHPLLTTHERIAASLGVRREGVTAAVGHLQALALIQCRRGEILLLDKDKLEAQSCECYDTLRREWQQLLPDATRAAPEMTVRDGRVSGRVAPNALLAALCPGEFPEVHAVVAVPKIARTTAARPLLTGGLEGLAASGCRPTQYRVMSSLR